MNKVNKLAGFKVGDKVKVKYITSTGSQKYNGQIAEITEIHKEPLHNGRPNAFGWVFLNGDTSDGTWLDELVKVETKDDDPNSVVKRTHIIVSDKQLSVQHTTNSKKERVGLLKQGVVMGHIRFSEIDTYIELLNQLKDEAFKSSAIK